jgi:hypothetical protein
MCHEDHTAKFQRDWCDGTRGAAGYLTMCRARKILSSQLNQEKPHRKGVRGVFDRESLAAPDKKHYMDPRNGGGSPPDPAQGG